MAVEGTLSGSWRHRELMGRAGKIEDAAMRQWFLKNVPVCRAIRAAYREALQR